MKMILVRHAETEWNLQDRAMGQLDSPLTPKEALVNEGLTRPQRRNLMADEF